MSRSLAPSPTATVCVQRDPVARRRTDQRPRLAGAVDDLPDQPAGQPAVGDLEGVGGGEVQPELVGERVGDLGEAAADDAAAEAQPLQRADQRARARRELEPLADLVEHLDGQAGQDARPGRAATRRSPARRSWRRR